MKKSDLHRKWAWVLDMCEGTGVNPRECVKIGEAINVKADPFFDLPPKYYTFMVAILEGRPLFVGDEVYQKRTGDKFDWDKGILGSAKRYQEALTRTPPVRTITLNGEKLPKPDDGHFYLYIAGFNHIQYGFKNGEDLIKVEAAINKLLSGK